MGAPAYTWLLSLIYVCLLLSHKYAAIINGIKIIKAAGSTAEISLLLSLRFCWPVYYKVDDSDFPSHITDKRGRGVYIYEHVGQAMTFRLLTDYTPKFIFSSSLHSYEEPMEYNLHLEPICGNPCTFVKFRPYIDKQSVSHIGDSSRNNEWDKKFPMDENLPKDENSGKLGRLKHPKCLYLIHLILLVTHFLWQTKKIERVPGRYC